MPLVRANATNPVVKWALETYGVLPYCWSHWTEHFPQLQRLDQELNGSAQGVKMKYGIKTHDMAYEKARVAELEALAAKWTAPDSGAVTLADLPEGDEDWGIEVIDIMESIVANRNRIFVINAPNEGAIPNLPHDAIVEVNAVVNGYGIRPIAVDPLHPALAAHLQGWISFEKHVVKAALGGSRADLLRAFLLDPNTSANLTLEETEAMVGELVAANAAWVR
jgi:alpha-galactosidase/6-phospho-beta-glucosidase family protein